MLGEIIKIMKKERIITCQRGGNYGLGDWHTHLPVLAATLFRQRPKRILELGSGHYSTGLIRSYSHGDPEVEAHSLENDFYPGWFAGLRWMETPQLKIHKVTKWDHERWSGPWDLVFIDHGPEEDRIPALDYYRTRSETVVIHDCNYMDRYGAILDKFDYVLHDRTHRFHTTAASSKHDVTSWL